MYSIVEIKGHQYRVQAGDTIDVQKMDEEVGKTIELKDVLFVGGKKVAVGAPLVEGAKVMAEITLQGRSRKEIVLKRKPGKYVKKNGHRQLFTGLLIKEIHDGQGNTEKADKKAASKAPAAEKKTAKKKVAKKKATTKKKTTKKA